MKVKELIKELEKCNPDAVVYCGWDEDFGPVKEVDCGNPANSAVDVHLYPE